MKQFWKTFKEELVTIPLLVFAFFVLNWTLSKAFPNSAFFDFFSQLETVAFRLVSFVIALTFAWLGLRVAFPQIYRYLHLEFYDKFDTLPDDAKRKYAVRFFLVFVICVALVSRSAGETNTQEIRVKITSTLRSQLHVREATPNAGKEVTKYLKSVGVNTPAPWCAAFVSWKRSRFDWFHL